MAPTLCTVAEAISMISGAPKVARFAVKVRIDAPYRDRPEAVFPGALQHSVCFTRAEAVRLVNGLHNPQLEAMGGRIPLAVRKLNGGPAVCYWIGG